MPPFELETMKDWAASIRSLLAQQGGIAPALCKLPIEAGHAKIFVPSSWFGKLHEWSGHEKCGSVPGYSVCKVNREEADRWFSGLVMHYLHGRGDQIAIIQHSVAKPGDRFLDSSKYAYFMHDAHVYYYFTSADSGPEDIVRARNLASAIGFVGILTSAPAGSFLHLNRQHIDRNLFDLLVTNTDFVIIGFHDGDTEIVWSKSQAA